MAQWIGGPVREPAIEDVLRGISPKQLRNKLKRVWHGEVENSVVAAGHIEPLDGGPKITVEARLVSVGRGDERIVGVVIRRTDLHVENGFASRRDPLTGLADRSALVTRLTTLLKGDRSADRRFAVLFIDLDYFKQVNDQFGHLVGDRALSEVAQRLVQCVRGGDEVFRYGGDEFVVLVENSFGDDHVEPVVARIHQWLSQPVSIRGEDVQLSASIGVADVTSRHLVPEDVLADADRAMYAAKRLATISHAR